jgi:hypothetical protein
MTPVITMAIILILGIVLGIAALAILAKVFKNFQPGDKKINADVAQMRKEIEAMNLDLVPWDKDETELFSLNQISQSVKKGITTTAKGVFTSIYQEPMLAYGFKKYVSPNLNAVLFAKTASHEYVYRIKKDSIQVTIDGKALGILKDDGVLYSTRKNKVLARIAQGSDELLLPMIVNNREVAHVVNPAKADKINPRAFDLVDENMTKEEEEVFLALGVLEVVQRSI